MSKSVFIIILGALVILWPHLGLPLGWQAWVLATLGGLIILTEVYALLLDYWRDYLSRLSSDDQMINDRTSKLPLTESSNRETRDE